MQFGGGGGQLLFLLKFRFKFDKLFRYSCIMQIDLILVKNKDRTWKIDLLNSIYWLHYTVQHAAKMYLPTHIFLLISYVLFELLVSVLFILSLGIIMKSVNKFLILCTHILRLI